MNTPALALLRIRIWNHAKAVVEGLSRLPQLDEELIVVGDTTTVITRGRHREQYRIAVRVVVERIQ